MAKYRKKPVVIEAWRWSSELFPPSNLKDRAHLVGLGQQYGWKLDDKTDSLIIPTLEGKMKARETRIREIQDVNSRFETGELMMWMMILGFFGVVIAGLTLVKMVAQ